MRLSRLLGFALAAAVVAACSRTDHARFPELEVVGGIPPDFSWHFQNGPDFYIYRATSDSRPGTEVGAYFGRAPSFKPGAQASPEIGSFAGHNVAWEAPSQPARALRRDALLPYRHSRESLELTLHLWVQAGSAEELSALQRALGAAKLRERGTPGPV